MNFGTRYNHHGIARGVDCSCDEVITKQEFAEECSIDRIMARYTRGGELPSALKEALYGDFSEAVDFVQAQEIVLHARAQFEALDAKVREKFQNDPTRFLEFVGDPKNEDEARKLGLLNPPPAPPEPTLVKFAPDELVKLSTLRTDPPSAPTDPPSAPKEK